MMYNYLPKKFGSLNYYTYLYIIIKTKKIMKKAEIKTKQNNLSSAYAVLTMGAILVIRFLVGVVFNV